MFKMQKLTKYFYLFLIFLVFGGGMAWGQTVTSVTPNSGPESGGQNVTINGTGLPADGGNYRYRIYFSSGNRASNENQTSPTTITCTTPAHAAGTVDVIVDYQYRSGMSWTSVAGWPKTITGGYTYIAAPVIDSRNPSEGSACGGTTLTINGHNFDPSANVTIGGVSATITNITSTRIICTTPSSTTGAKTITVTNPDGQHDDYYSFTYNVDISSVSPNSGPEAGGTNVTIYGCGFTGGSGYTYTVAFGGNNATNISYTSGNITCMTPSGTGIVNVTVTAYRYGFQRWTATLTNGFTYIAPLPAPTVSGIDPTHGPATIPPEITISGSNFVSGATVRFGALTPVASTFVSSSSIKCFPPAGGSGTVSVTVINPDTKTGVSPVNYTFDPPPAITGINPDHGSEAGLNSVTINGSNFDPSPTVTFGANPATGISVNGAHTVITCTAPAGTGTVTVTVKNPDNQTATTSYTYNPPPTVTSVVASSGPSGTPVTVYGSNFITGSTTITFGGVSTPCTVTSLSTLTCNVPVHTLGPVDIIVTANGQVSAALTGGFTYLPGISNVNPSVGPITGGTTVTITGSAFSEGAPSVTIGGNPATGISVTNDNTLTCITPGHAAGAVNVVVTVSGFSNTLNNGFTYFDPPTITNISPNGGPVAGGQTVTITGTNFLNGSTTVVVDGAPVSATIVNSTTITFTTLPHSAGAVDVQVIAPGGSVTNTGGYTYYDPPTILTVDPPAGPLGGNQPVTITGTNFVAGSTTVTFGGSSATVGSVLPATISCTTPGHGAGTVTVIVTTPGGIATKTNAYSYMAAPTITSITPNGGPVVGGQPVTIVGTNYLDGYTYVDIGFHSASPVVVTLGTTINISTPAGSAGPAVVTITAPGGQVTGTYTYYVPPVITGVNRSAGPTTGAQVVTITGTNLQTGVVGNTKVKIGSSTVTPTSVNATTVVFTTPAHAAGPVTISVTTLGGESNTNPYLYIDPPVITGVDKIGGPIAGGQTVVITGSNFDTGPGNTTVSIGGNTVTPTSFDATSITFTTPFHLAGAVTISVTTLGGSSNTAPYTYYPLPVITSIDKNAGSALGGQTVTITGTNLQSGAVSNTSVTIGDNPVTPTTVNGTTVMFTTPAHLAGAVTISVTTLGGTSNTIAYTYYDPPTITDVSPNLGTAAGGTPSVTITGTNFVTGAGNTTVTFGGTPATAVVVAGGGTSLTCTPPEHIAATVDVVVTTPAGSVTSTGAYMFQLQFTSLNPIYGYTTGGTVVTINGYGFGPGATVAFGSTMANVTNIAPRTITCTTPALSEGVYTVYVNMGTQQANLPNSYTYIFPMEVLSITPNTGNFWGNDPVTITGVGFSTSLPATVTFRNNAATNVSVVNPTTITCTTPGGYGTVDVRVNQGPQSNTKSNAFEYGFFLVPTVSTPTNIQPTSFTANWVKYTLYGIESFTNYHLQVSTDPAFPTGPNTQNYTINNINTVSYNVSGLDPTKIYYYHYSINIAIFGFWPYESPFSPYALVNRPPDLASDGNINVVARMPGSLAPIPYNIVIGGDNIMVLNDGTNKAQVRNNGNGLWLAANPLVVKFYLITTAEYNNPSFVPSGPILAQTTLNVDIPVGGTADIPEVPIPVPPDIAGVRYACWYIDGSSQAPFETSLGNNVVKWGTPFSILPFLFCTECPPVVPPGLSISVPEGKPVEVPLKISELKNLPIAKYDISIKYDNSLLEFKDIDKTGSLSEAWNLNIEQKDNRSVTIHGSGDEYLKGDGELVKLLFQGVGGSGESYIEFKDFMLNGTIPVKTENIKVKVGNTITRALTNIELPKEFVLEQNYPNPFNPTTIIRYALPKASSITLSIFDVLGKEVKVEKGKKEAGWYEVEFNARDLTSGTYFYVLEVHNENQSNKIIKKMLLLK